jgi:hypothetical protein
VEESETTNELLRMRAAVDKLDPEARLRLRNWINKSFDAWGLSRDDARTEAYDRLYYVTDFDRSNMRELQWNGRRKDRGLPPDTGGVYAIASDRDWLYVGKATSLANRRRDHAANLRHDSHQNALLQRHWKTNDEPIWFIVLERWPRDVRLRRGGEHPAELRWKRRLRPLYDREARKADVSLLIHP